MQRSFRIGLPRGSRTVRSSLLQATILDAAVPTVVLALLLAAAIALALAAVLLWVWPTKAAPLE